MDVAYAHWLDACHRLENQRVANTAASAGINARISEIGAELAKFFTSARVEGWQRSSHFQEAPPPMSDFERQMRLENRVRGLMKSGLFRLDAERKAREELAAFEAEQAAEAARRAG